MPLFTVKMASFDFMMAKYTEALDKAVQAEMKKAAREFLKVAAPSVPVRTGFARGSLGNLQEAIGQTAGERFLDQARKLKNTVFKIFGRKEKKSVAKYVEYYRGVLKTPESGKQFATTPSAIFTRIGYLYNFQYKIDIDYFTILDVRSNKRVKSAPWKAFEKGRDAFNKYLRTNMMKSLPKLKNFIVTQEVTVNSNGNISKSTSIIK